MYVSVAAFAQRHTVNKYKEIIGIPIISLYLFTVHPQNRLPAIFGSKNERLILVELVQGSQTQ